MRGEGLLVGLRAVGPSADLVAALRAEKLLTDGPSAWPLPPEESLVFQNGLHDLQVRKNRAGKLC